MNWLLFTAALALPPRPPPEPPAPWRLVDAPALHIGVRPAFYADREELAAGVTLQVTGHVL